MRTGAFAPSDASRFDECDIVIRFNDCQSAGEGGLKTDVVAVCNTGRPAYAMIRQRSWRERWHLVFAQLQQRVLARFAVEKQADGFNGLSDDKLP